MISEVPYRDVVFLGAGASIAAGLPVSTNFTQHLLAARNSLLSLIESPTAIQLIDQDIAWLKDVQERLHDISCNLKGFNPDNIEDIFRFWGYERGSKIQMPGSTPNLIPGYQYPRLIRMLALALAYCPRFQSAHDLKRPNVYSWFVEKLFDTIKPGEQIGLVPIIVTTNYDLLIEFAVSARSDLDLTYTYNEYIGLRNIFCREDTARCTLHYLKLHGSINWWGNRPGFRVSKEGALNTINSDSPLLAVAERYKSAGVDIEMVPPAILKDVIYRQSWTEVWDEAQAVFCMCRHLIIIGYSFSQGDILVFNLVTLGLARSPYLESIVVIDPHADYVLHRIKSFFSDEFISRIKWIGYEQKFDDNVPKWAGRDLFFCKS